MTVPEAAVHKDCRIVFAQNDVRSARERRDIDPETESCGKKSLADKKFRSGVLAPDMRHAFVPLFLCHSVGHMK